ncbi:hypothetical protein ASD04_17155 [Devosia sp. Root436]|uniref:hypothetical protein n=1 Tax=Devosia sp. Root436 TaxID=1736537 RepID=UPI0006FD2FA8|nr:hypothetical protein [Devosia sp. Root436]KQX34364.1 hypothetical protein ASD04_17155 [Devosia sp. Root436]
MVQQNTPKSVLAIGIDPAFVDLSTMPGFTADVVRAYLDAQINRIAEFGYDVESCLIDLGDTAERVVEKALRSKSFDCVVIGAGLREPPELLLLFEKVINLVHTLAPGARIAFNSNPTDTAEAAERWLGSPD